MSGHTSWPERAEESAPPAPTAGLVREVTWVMGYFVVTGAVAGLVWWQVVDPPYFVRNSQGGVMAQAQLSRRVQADGWFVTIGVVAGLIGGTALTRWRDRLPLVTVVVGSVASLGGGALALGLGKLLGHRDVTALLKHAEVGAHVRDSLDVISDMVLLAWPVGFLIGTVAILWGTKGRQPHVQGPDESPDN